MVVCVQLSTSWMQVVHFFSALAWCFKSFVIHLMHQASSVASAVNGCICNWSKKIVVVDHELPNGSSEQIRVVSFTDGEIIKGGPREPWHDIHCKLDPPHHQLCYQKIVNTGMCSYSDQSMVGLLLASLRHQRKQLGKGLFLGRTPLLTGAF